eukprot:GILK01010467.1.p1 GENE.GILK01010467.1~~GILK01010467.1.p1  ORF type:complete len:1056 (-),score=224.29 GILK01010467.1:118-3285(-)
MKADITPVQVDSSVGWESVGGLDEHVRAVKEMVMLPLLYPELFHKLNVTPPRGVLFYGPPGTGKTLVARALANTCSESGQRVSFFMRKGADCLSKWVGEAERQLRLLFEQAQKNQPSIIFFDEIDGLAPVRSAKQDQIHSSIVSTMLALMDGLDNRGQVIVIGATNRIDSIDPALRRPGRFDRELAFSLPNEEARKKILEIHTNNWTPSLPESMRAELACLTVGYCGADIKALCAEASLCAVRRRYPQIYKSAQKLVIDLSQVQVTAPDFAEALKMVTPASHRAVAVQSRPLSPAVAPLLHTHVAQAVRLIQRIFPAYQRKRKMGADRSNPILEWAADPTTQATNAHQQQGFDVHLHPSGSPNTIPLTSSSASSSTVVSISTIMRYNTVSAASGFGVATAAQQNQVCEPFELLRNGGRVGCGPPRVLVHGLAGMGQSTYVAPAVLHCLESLPVYSLDYPALVADTSSRSLEESVVRLFVEARRNAPSIVYLPRIDSWWQITPESLHSTLLWLLRDMPPELPILFFATMDDKFPTLPPELSFLFDSLYDISSIGDQERTDFFLSLIEDIRFVWYRIERQRLDALEKQARFASQRVQHLNQNEHMDDVCVSTEMDVDFDTEVLPVAPPPPPKVLSGEELEALEEEEETWFRELRILLRAVCKTLMQEKAFKVFERNVDPDDYPDYYEIILEPMCVSDVIDKIDSQEYSTVKQFMRDMKLIVRNAKEYNPLTDSRSKEIVSRACAFHDKVSSLVDRFVPEMKNMCELMNQRRVAREAAYPELAEKRRLAMAALKVRTLPAGSDMSPSASPRTDKGQRRHSARLKGESLDLIRMEDFAVSKRKHSSGKNADGDMDVEEAAHEDTQAARNESEKDESNQIEDLMSVDSTAHADNDTTEQQGVLNDTISSIAAESVIDNASEVGTKKRKLSQQDEAQEVTGSAREVEGDHVANAMALESDVLSKKRKTDDAGVAALPSAPAPQAIPATNRTVSQVTPLDASRLSRLVQQLVLGTKFMNLEQLLALHGRLSSAVHRVVCGGTSIDLLQVVEDETAACFAQVS